MTMAWNSLRVTTALGPPVPTPAMSPIRLRLLAIVLMAVTTVAGAHHVGQAPTPAQDPGLQAPVVSIAGVLEELVVEDTVGGTTHRFKVLIGEDGRARLAKGPALALVVPGTEVLVRGRTAGAIVFVSDAKATGSAGAGSVRTKAAELTRRGKTVNPAVFGLTSDDLAPLLGKTTTEVAAVA